MSLAGIRPELLLLMFASGLVISCLSTFLGVGGGIMMVPLLIFLFPKFGVSSICAVHLAIGTACWSSSSAPFPPPSVTGAAT